MLTLKLKPREERRLRAGHLWVYSNEIDTASSPLGEIEAGSLCCIVDARGSALGVGYVNPHTLLAARVLSGSADAEIDTDWFARRIRSALALRERIYRQPYYRLIYGESDGLPGLVVDRFGEQLVVQVGTAGMEALHEEFTGALTQVLRPTGILFRNDMSVRKQEGLEEYTEEAGEVPELLELEEGGVRFEVSPREGQKTGWFFDQRDNRDRMTRYAGGARVLDVFSYVGAWGLRAAKAGAKSVTCIDSSAPAIEGLTRNAQRNGLTVETRQGQALEQMEMLAADKRQFDLVIVDPPALIKRKKDLGAGQSHYASLTRAAMRLLAPDAILVSCSCSFHLEAEDLQRVLLRESRKAGKRLQILETGSQGPDHPVHPAIPETRYLKAFFCRVTVIVVVMAMAAVVVAAARGRRRRAVRKACRPGRRTTLMRPMPR